MVSAVIDTRAHERLMRSAVSAELARWGGWIERHMDYEGYPSENFLLAFTHGRGGERPGHRILCHDMPAAIYETHRNVLRLPDQLQEALWIRYVPHVRADGTTWNVGEKCRLADLSEDVLYQRVHRAKSLLVAIIF